MMSDLSLMKKLAWGQFWLLLIMASYLSLTPKPGAIFEGSPDKLLHLVGWVGLTLSLQLAHYSEPLWSQKRLQHRLFSLFVYSLLIEVGQYFSPGRFFSLADMLANAAGISLACGLIWLFFPIWKKYFLS